VLVAWGLALMIGAALFAIRALSPPRPEMAAMHEAEESARPNLPNEAIVESQPPVETPAVAPQSQGQRALSEPVQPVLRDVPAAPAASNAVPAAGPSMPAAEVPRVPQATRPAERSLQAVTPASESLVPPGPLTAEQVQTGAGERRRDVASCYASDKEAKDGAKVELALVVEPSGRVTDASVFSARPLGRARTDCIELKARAWRFPAPGGAVAQELRIPFVVVPGSGG